MPTHYPEHQAVHVHASRHCGKSKPCDVESQQTCQPISSKLVTAQGLPAVQSGALSAHRASGLALHQLHHVLGEAELRAALQAAQRLPAARLALGLRHARRLRQLRQQLARLAPARSPSVGVSSKSARQSAVSGSALIASSSTQYLFQCHGIHSIRAPTFI